MLEVYCRTISFYCRAMAAAVALLMLLTGCDSASEKLKAASELVNTRPDSAYVMLRDIDFNSLGADSLRARYVMTKALANIHVGRSLITDTLLNDAATYYLSAADTANWAIVSQLLSGYDFTRGDAESALRRLEEVRSRAKSRELAWDTNILLLEVSLNSQKYTNAYNYADWLLRHTDAPSEILKFATAKAVASFYQGEHARALSILDSIIARGIPRQVGPEASGEFYQEYAEILNGAGYSRKAIGIIDSLTREGCFDNGVGAVTKKVSLALYYTNLGDTDKAMALLDSINHGNTQSALEVYTGIGMMKAALLYKNSGRFPSELMHTVAKTIERNYLLSQYDRQTAMESVIELNDDNYRLKLQRQRLWLLVCGILLTAVVGGIIVYTALSRRKQRLVEAEERAETLESMLKDAEKYAQGSSVSSDAERLKAVLLRQLGIFKTFAGTPTPQSRDALRKISIAGKDRDTMEQLVDWPEFYSMIDSLYGGFHKKLTERYPGTFNDKEQQIIVLLKAGFSTKEIGVLTEQSSATIYTRKSVIRKKLAAAENADFIALIDEQTGTS